MSRIAIVGWDTEMKYGDLSSIVQLGVGLNVGTALLQLYGEFGVAPLGRKIARTRTLFHLPESERPPQDIEEELDRLESRYELFKIDFFNQYRWFVMLNLMISAFLSIILVFIAVYSDELIQANYWFVIIAIAGSLLPAPVTLGVLYIDGQKRVKDLEAVAENIEYRALQAIG